MGEAGTAAASRLLCLLSAGFAAAVLFLLLLADAAPMHPTGLEDTCLPVVFGGALLLGMLRVLGLLADLLVCCSCSVLNSGVLQSAESACRSCRLRLPAAAEQITACIQM